MELKTFSGRKASQHHFELTSFINFLKESGVKRYLEIGARHGDTFHEVMINLPEGSTGIAVDMPGGLWGRRGTDRALKAATEDLKSKGYDVDIIIGNSQERTVIQTIKALGPFDAILIDGDHTLSGVTKDWVNYKDLAPIVAFHDIVGTGQFEKVSKRKVEVPLLWNEIKQAYPVKEFIGLESLMGIGVALMK